MWSDNIFPGEGGGGCEGLGGNLSFACQGRQIELAVGHRDGSTGTILLPSPTFENPVEVVRATVNQAAWRSLQVCSEAEKRRNKQVLPPPSGHSSAVARAGSFWPRCALNPHPAA